MNKEDVLIILALVLAFTLGYFSGKSANDKNCHKIEVTI